MPIRTCNPVVKLSRPEPGVGYWVVALNAAIQKNLEGAGGASEDGCSDIIQGWTDPGLPGSLPEADFTVLDPLNAIARPTGMRTRRSSRPRA